MPDQPTALDPTRVFETLNRHGVDYLVIGGFAVIAHGHVRATKDVDVVASEDRENLERFAAALRELGAQLRGVDAQYLPVDPTNADDLGNGANWTMVTDAGWLDFMAEPPGAAPYPQLRARSVRRRVRSVDIPIVGLDDLVRMKQAAGRPRDLADIAALTAATDEDQNT
ncbi:hypothetical protein BH23ACT10_BH23ACT10_07160 [soil metagenome]